MNSSSRSRSSSDSFEGSSGVTGSDGRPSASAPAAGGWATGGCGGACWAQATAAQHPTITSSVNTLLELIVITSTSLSNPSGPRP